jgi:hypothetical protein
MVNHCCSAGEATHVLMVIVLQKALQSCTIRQGEGWGPYNGGTTLPPARPGPVGGPSPQPVRAPVTSNFATQFPLVFATTLRAQVPSARSTKLRVVCITKPTYTLMHALQVQRHLPESSRDAPDDDLVV